MTRPAHVLAPPLGPDGPERGWSFIETIVVIGIVLLLMTTVAVVSFKAIDQAKVAQAKGSISALKSALEMYRSACGSYPSEEEGLLALVQRPESSQGADRWSGPYVESLPASDPWGNPYAYALVSGGQGCAVRSLGSDGREGGSGTAADISSEASW
jgi:general secretion pathway protein G